MQEWGAARIGTSDVRKVLLHLAGKGMTPREMAKELGCGEASVRERLRACGVGFRGTSFPDRVKAAGFRDVRGFFLAPANAKKTTKQLAEDYGFNQATVSKWYARLLEEVKGGRV